MNITLTQEQSHLVQGKVASGKFASEAAVIDKALQLLHQQDQAEQEWIKDLNGKIEEGLEELRQGKGIPGEVAFQELRAYAKKRREEIQSRS